MLRLPTLLSCLFLALSLSAAEAQTILFQISDASSRDYKIANLTIKYSDGKVTDGFRVIEENNQKLVRWSEITSLEIGTVVGDGTATKYVECSVEFSDATTRNLHCIDGMVSGKTRNGDYKKPLHQVKALLPQK